MNANHVKGIILLFTKVYVTKNLEILEDIKRKALAKTICRNIFKVARNVNLKCFLLPTQMFFLLIIFLEMDASCK